MQKTAQKRSLVNKLKEMTNIKGITAEKYFEPELLRAMTELRKTDNNIRSVILGKSIDGGDPGSDPVSFKSLLKSAKTNLNRREYMMAISDLGSFHKKLFDITKLIASFNFDIDKVHNLFLFKELEKKHPERLKSLQDLNTRWANYNQNMFIKEAGIMDFFHNIGSPRGRALSAWEKRYPEKVRELREQSLMILSKSQSLYDNLLEILKTMAAGRAARDIDQYTSAAALFTKSYQKYDNDFKTFYIGVVKPLIDKAEIFAPPKIVDVKNPAEIGKQDIGATPQFSAELNAPQQKSVDNSPTDRSPQTFNQEPSPAVLDLTKSPQAVQPSVPSLGPMPKAQLPLPNISDDPGPITKRSPDTKEQLSLFPAAHTQFLNFLEKLSNEKPEIVSAYIKKYARSIQNTDLETSIKLFSIAKSIGS